MNGKRHFKQIFSFFKGILTKKNISSGLSAAHSPGQSAGPGKSQDRQKPGPALIEIVFIVFYLY
jgi:hypothetical protein